MDDQLTPEEEQAKEAQERRFQESHRGQDTSTFDDTELASGQKGGQKQSQPDDENLSATVTRQEYDNQDYGDVPPVQADNIDEMTPEE